MYIKLAMFQCKMIIIVQHLGKYLLLSISCVNKSFTGVCLNFGQSQPTIISIIGSSADHFLDENELFGL